MAMTIEELEKEHDEWSERNLKEKMESEEYKVMLAEKAVECQKLIESVKKATKMVKPEFDAETQKYKNVELDLPEEVRKAAIEYLMQLATNNYETYTIFHGQDSMTDFIYWLRFDHGKVELVSELDSGITHHNYYGSSDIRRFLYGVSIVEDAKKNLKSIEIERRK